MAYIEGSVVTAGLRKVNESYYVLFSPDMLDYLGINRETATQDDTLVLKFDKGKHGRFIGIGKH